MARPYSKKTVDQAEEICLCAANNDFDTFCIALGLDGFAAELGIPQHATALRLAFAAYKEVPKTGTFQGIALEAAALIRSGWMIGDPVDLLDLPVETDVVENATQVANPVDMQHEAASLQAQIDNPPEFPALPGLSAGYPAPEPCASYAKAMDASVPVEEEPIEHYNGDYGADS